MFSKFQIIFPGTVNTIETYLETNARVDDGGAKIHYGTWESAIYGLAHYNELRPIRQKLYPERLPKFTPNLESRGMVHRSEVNKNKWTIPFLGSDKSVITRTQRFFFDFYKQRPVQVATFYVAPSFFAIIAMALFGLVFKLLTSFEWGRSLLLKVSFKNNFF